MGFDQFLLNSVIRQLRSTLSVDMGTLAAYCFSRYKIPAGEHLFFYILATRLGPPIAYALPMYLIFDKLGIANSHIGLILAHATFNLVLVVWMMKAFFDDVPREVEEASGTRWMRSVSGAFSDYLADVLRRLGIGRNLRSNFFLERTVVRIDPYKQ